MPRFVSFSVGAIQCMRLAHSVIREPFPAKPKTASRKQSRVVSGGVPTHRRPRPPRQGGRHQEPRGGGVSVRISLFREHIYFSLLKK